MTASSDPKPFVAVVVERQFPRAAWRELTEHVVEALRKNGVLVRRYESWGGGAQVWEVPSTPPDGWAKRAAFTLWIGTGGDAVDVSKSVARWKEVLSAFHEVRWLHPLPPHRWSVVDHALAERYPMRALSRDGLRALESSAVGEDGWPKEKRLRPTLAMDLDPASDRGFAALVQELGSAFPLLKEHARDRDSPDAAALVKAVLTGKDVDPHDLLCLLALPLFREKRWPSGLRERLRSPGGWRGTASKVCLVLGGALIVHGLAANGCAPPARPVDAGPQEAACSAPRTACPDGCFDLSADARHCGGCDLGCDGGVSCSNGKCQVSPDLPPAPTPTACDPQQGPCGPQPDAASAPPACPVGEVRCQGRCSDLQHDRAHCGGCEQPCPAGVICRNGSCDSRSQRHMERQQVQGVRVMTSREASPSMMRPAPPR